MNFEFLNIEIKVEKIINEGVGLYYTLAKLHINEMKEIARAILKNLLVIFTIQMITEIDRDTFILKGGNPNSY